MTLDGVAPHRDPVDTESGYDEKKLDDSTPRYVDAFGDESNAEVKYKTMEWWLVSNSFARDQVALRNASLTLSPNYRQTGMCKCLKLAIS